MDLDATDAVARHNEDSEGGGKNITQPRPFKIQWEEEILHGKDTKDIPPQKNGHIKTNMCRIMQFVN